MKAFEPTDPMEPVAVSLATPGFDGVSAMGRTFVEEFAMMGWSRDRIARMFCHTPVTPERTRCGGPRLRIRGGTRR